MLMKLTPGWTLLKRRVSNQLFLIWQTKGHTFWRLFSTDLQQLSSCDPSQSIQVFCLVDSSFLVALRKLLPPQLTKRKDSHRQQGLYRCYKLKCFVNWTKWMCLLNIQRYFLKCLRKNISSFVKFFFLYYCIILLYCITCKRGVIDHKKD